MKRVRLAMVALSLAAATTAIFRYELGLSFSYEDCAKSAAEVAKTGSAFDQLHSMCREQYAANGSHLPPRTRFADGALPKWHEVLLSTEYVAADTVTRDAIQSEYRNELAYRSFLAGAPTDAVKLWLAKFDAQAAPTFRNRLRLWWLEMRE
jgi:hypothetical protein